MLSLPFGRQISRAVSILFPLVFVVAGAGIMITTYLDGVPGRGFDRYVPFIVGGVFVVVGAIVLMKAVKGRAETDRMQKAMEKHEDEPWRVRPEWQSNEIVSEARIDRSLLIFTLLWNAISWPAAFVFLSEVITGDEFEWPILFISLFPMIGIGFFIKVMIEWRRIQKFGRSILTLDSLPGRLGRPIGGAIKTGVSAQRAPEEGFRVTLTCYRQYVRYTRDSDGDRTKRIERDVLWRDEATRTGRAYGDGTRLTVPFAFDVPPDKPSSTPVKSENRDLWEVEIKAAVPGIDYKDAIEVPVFPPDEPMDVPDTPEYGADTSTYGSDHPMREATGDGAPASDSPVPASAQQMKPRDPAYGATDEMFDKADGFDGTLSDGISLTDAPGQFELHFAPKRQRRAALMLGVIGLAMVVGGGFLFGVSLLFAIICVGLGGLLVYGSIQKFTNDTVLTIRGGMIELTHDGVGMPDEVTFPARHLVETRADVESGEKGNVTYAIFMIASEDAELDTLKKQAASATTVMKAMGVEEDYPMKRRMEEGMKRPQVRVAGGFDKKEEADWLAQEIFNAAQREAAF
jgi:hypothetical protein